MSQNSIFKKLKKKYISKKKRVIQGKQRKIIETIRVYVEIIFTEV